MKKEEFRKLPFHKKVTWLIRHRSVDFLLAALLLFLMGSLIYEEHFKQPVCMNVEMINVCTDSPGGESFDPFLRQMGYQENSRNVEISKMFQLGDADTDLKVNPDKLLMCRVGQGKTDVYFWDTDDMEEALVKMALMDLREILPHEVLVANQDKLLYTGPILQGGYPYGIFLEDNEWVRENNYSEDCMVGVARTAKDLDLVRSFLLYILNG